MGHVLHNLETGEDFSALTEAEALALAAAGCSAQARGGGAPLAPASGAVGLGCPPPRRSASCCMPPPPRLRGPPCCYPCLPSQCQSPRADRRSELSAGSASTVRSLSR